jgi:hypothetical protein
MYISLGSGSAEHLSSKHKALGLIPTIAKEKKKEYINLQHIRNNQCLTLFSAALLKSYFLFVVSFIGHYVF